MSIHLYRIKALSSSSDGLVQYIEMKLLAAPDNESHWTAKTIKVTQAVTNDVNSFTFLTDLPSAPLVNNTVLIATQGFANLGIVTPDVIVPAGVLFVGGGTVNFAGVDSVI